MIRLERVPAFSSEYVVWRDGHRAGLVTKWDGIDGQNWSANCNPDGCWCHGFYRTRKEAAEALCDTKEAS